MYCNDKTEKTYLYVSSIFHVNLFRKLLLIKTQQKCWVYSFPHFLQLSLFTLAIAVNNQIYYIALNAISLCISADDLR
jgi:hypothetical protein